MMTKPYETLNCVKEKQPRIISMLHAIYNKAIASIIKLMLPFRYWNPSRSYRTTT